MTVLVSPCREWQGSTNSRGYGKKYVGGRYVRAHRWTWEQAHGPIPDGLVVMHICDNPPCVELTHLRLGTQAENLGDMREKGRHPRRMPSDDEVRRIIERLHAGESPLSIAPDFGVSRQLVGRIGSGRARRDIARPAGFSYRPRRGVGA